MRCRAGAPRARRRRRSTRASPRCCRAGREVADRLAKTFRFANYHETMAFVNAIAWIAHRADHHPDLSVHYNRCVVSWSTHDAGGITQQRPDLRRARRAPARLTRKRGARAASAPRTARPGSSSPPTAATSPSCSTTASALDVRAQGRVARRSPAAIASRSRASPAAARSRRSLPRTNLVYRSDAFKEKLIAANVTQVIGVVAPDLPVDEELIDRWIVAAEAERLPLPPRRQQGRPPRRSARCVERLAPYAALGYTVVALSAKRDAAPLLAHGSPASTACSSASPAWASRTILNALVPDAARAYGGGFGRARDRTPHDDARRRCTRSPAIRATAGSSTRRA